jgi:hypothetical protein
MANEMRKAAYLTRRLSRRLAVSGGLAASRETKIKTTAIHRKKIFTKPKNKPSAKG